MQLNFGRPSLMAVTAALALTTSAYALATLATTASTTTTTGTVVLPTATASTSTATPTATATASTLVATSTTPDYTFGLGVQTHFSQGWPASNIALAQQVKAGFLRDSVPWTGGEKVAGVYDFSSSGAASIAKACEAGLKVTLTIQPMNPLYDGGKVVYTPAGQAAYGNYLKALMGKYGACIAGFEIGNEINGGSFTSNYVAGTVPATTYLGLLGAVKTGVKSIYPDVKILGGSTNMVATGFLEPLFAAGMLPLIDGVVVHPYRTQAQSIDIEIANLIKVMKKYGTPAPVWVTEWSHDVADKAFAADELVKMVTLMSASGVSQASWYALIDQKSFPNMGLFTGTAIKPQGQAYQFAQTTLIPQGRPTRVDFGDPLLFAYRFGADRWVVWGSPRTITLSGGQAYTATGQALSGTTLQVGASPVVIVGGGIAATGASNLVADSMLGYGTGQWTYYARTGTTKLVDNVLGLFNDSYTSYYGDRWYRPLRINMLDGAPAGTGAAPIRTVMRYTSSGTQSLDLWACWSKSATTGDGIDYTINVNGVAKAKGVNTTRTALNGVQLNLIAGDKVDVIVGPNQTYGGDSYNYRVSLYRRGTGIAPVCP
jgi:hypothetical protein